MRTRGMTLVELVTAMVLAGILLLVMTCQFIAHQRIATGINNRNAAAQEAVVAMRHMSHVLKFARSSSPVPTITPSPINLTTTRALSVSIMGGYISEFTPIASPYTPIKYLITSGGVLQYRRFSAGVWSSQNIATGLIFNESDSPASFFSFPASQSVPGHYDFVINLAVARGNAIVKVQTTIHTLPE